MQHTPPASNGESGRFVTSPVQNPQEGLTAAFCARMKKDTALLFLCAYRGKNTPESLRNPTEKGTVLLSVSMAAGPYAFENAA